MLTTCARPLPSVFFAACDELDGVVHQGFDLGMVEPMVETRHAAVALADRAIDPTGGAIAQSIRAIEIETGREVASVAVPSACGAVALAAQFGVELLAVGSTRTGAQKQER